MCRLLEKANNKMLPAVLTFHIYCSSRHLLFKDRFMSVFVFSEINKQLDANSPFEILKETNLIVNYFNQIKHVLIGSLLLFMNQYRAEFFSHFTKQCNRCSKILRGTTCIIPKSIIDRKLNKMYNFLGLQSISHLM